MNIFFLDFNPRRAAEYHCDKHVVKMILETAQLLYTAHWLSDRNILPQNAYRQTHFNHPCAIWARESLSNYTWLCELGMALCEEYTFRYGKVHKTQSHIHWLITHPPDIVDIGITPIRQAMPEECKRPNPVEGYRTYYCEKKVPLLKYSKRPPPDFIGKRFT